MFQPCSHIHVQNYRWSECAARKAIHLLWRYSIKINVRFSFLYLFHDKSYIIHWYTTPLLAPFIIHYTPSHCSTRRIFFIFSVDRWLHSMWIVLILHVFMKVDRCQQTRYVGCFICEIKLENKLRVFSVGRGSVVYTRKRGSNTIQKYCSILSYFYVWVARHICIFNRNQEKDF